MEDRAPNRETGDGCEQPRAITETLVQARVAITGIAFILSYSFTGAIGSPPGRRSPWPTCSASRMRKAQGCQHRRHLFLATNVASHPASHIFNPFFGPIQTADGTTVAESISDFANCSQSGNSCLLAPIDKDIHGNPVTDDNFIWTGTVPDGTNGDGLPDCQDWTSNSASDIGTGGNTGQTSFGFTTGLEDSCDKTHHVMCLQFQ